MKTKQQLIDNHYLRLISSIHKDKKKLLQVNLFINDSIKSFLLEKKNVGWLVSPQAEYSFVIGSRRLFIGQERDFLVSCIITIKPEET
jgi:hypothetical protein